MEDTKPEVIVINRREFMVAVAGGILSAIAKDRSATAGALKKEVPKDKKSKVSLVKTSDRESGIKRAIDLLMVNPVMVFVGGPRQVGKTTLCRNFVATHYKKPAYFNWDNRTDRKSIMASSWPGDAELIIFELL